jgi:hypothetical protein
MGVRDHRMTTLLVQWQDCGIVQVEFSVEQFDGPVHLYCYCYSGLVVEDVESAQKRHFLELYPVSMVLRSRMATLESVRQEKQPVAAHLGRRF